ncbi:MAG: hypothetical protein V4722_03905 [Bacteroidota bacterium]
MKPTLKFVSGILFTVVTAFASEKSIAQVSGIITIPGDYPTITAALNLEQAGTDTLVSR